MTTRLLYVSRVDPATTPVDLASIVSSSQVWNRKHDVTGMLVASARHFAQVLEGREAAIDEVMARIRADTRHVEVHERLRETVRHRRFERWSMVHVPRDDLQDLLARLHGDAPDPQDLQQLLAEMDAASRDRSLHL